MMRQAGRYHSHYQQLKQKYTFEQLCREPDLACEVTLGPIQEFDLSFSPGPVFEKNLTKSMLDNVQISAFEEYIQFQHQALQNIRSALPSNKSLIGFTGGPITLYHFAIRNNPIADNLFEQALPILQKLIEKNIAIQFQNDIDLLMIFDTEANQLTDQEFQDFCLPFIKQIANQYHSKIGYFTKNISPNKFELLKKISNLQLTVLGTQHNIFQELPQTHLTLQGNFSNDLLTISEKSHFLSALEEYIDLCKSYDVSQRAGWIASLDHGVQKITPETNIHLFIDQIRTKLA
jgi:uroporphyrinogen decarboxylase